MPEHFDGNRRDDKPALGACDVHAFQVRLGRSKRTQLPAVRGVRPGGVASVDENVCVLGLGLRCFFRSKFGFFGASARSSPRCVECALAGLRVWMRMVAFVVRACDVFSVLSSAFSEQAHAARAGHVCALVGMREGGMIYLVLSSACSFSRSEFGFFGASARSTCGARVRPSGVASVDENGRVRGSGLLVPFPFQVRLFRSKRTLQRTATNAC